MEAILAKVVTIVVLTHGIRAVGRLVGPRWSGLILGLPASTAIVLFFLTQDHGVAFATCAAGASLLGLAAAVGLALTFSLLVGRGRSLMTALAGGVAGYLAAAALLRLVPDLGLLVVPLLVAVILGGMVLAHRLGSIPAGGPAQPPSLWRSLLLRTLVPVVCLLGVLTLADRVGPCWAGLLGTFPGTLLAVLVVTYLESGPPAAALVARAFPLGNLSMVSFLVVFRYGCPALGLIAALGLGYLAAFLTLLVAEAIRRLIAGIASRPRPAVSCIAHRRPVASRLRWSRPPFCGGRRLVVR